MSIKKIISIYDTKAEAYLPPQFVQSNGSAVRGFADAINDKSNPDNNLAKHPEDFIMFDFGSFDDTTGKFDIFKAPEELVRGITLMEQLYPTE